MKIILSIGYRHFLLPANANINALLATLSKAVVLKHEYVNGYLVYFHDTERDEKVKIEMVDDNAVIDPKKVKRKALPEHASEDAHNTFGGGTLSL